jgi:hypothetical protein
VKLTHVQVGRQSDDPWKDHAVMMLALPGAWAWTRAWGTVFVVGETYLRVLSWRIAR